MASTRPNREDEITFCCIRPNRWKAPLCGKGLTIATIILCIVTLLVVVILRVTDPMNSKDEYLELAAFIIFYVVLATVIIILCLPIVMTRTVRATQCANKALIISFIVCVAYLLVFTFFLEYDEVDFSESPVRDGISFSLVLACIIMIFILAGYLILNLILGKCYDVYIPQYCRGERKRMQKNALSLEEILELYFKQIPDDQQLNSINLETQKNFDKLIEKLKENDHFGEVNIKLAGSTAERYNSPATPHWICSEVGELSRAIITDFDYMISPKEKKACFSDSETYKIIFEDENLRPGYVYLANKENTNTSAKRAKKALSLCVGKMNIHKFEVFEPSETSYERRITFIYATVNMKGPAIELRCGDVKKNTNRFWTDITLAIKCDEWPVQISDWTYRENRKWPSQEEVDEIAKHGCHIVPKSQKGDRKGMTWRLSFSEAEVLLSKKVPKVARMCFVGLKIIVRDYLKVLCKKLSSYKLKCIFLYTLEKSDPSIWLKEEEENIKQCFEMLLSNFLDALKEKNCPHFWIPKVNLFEEFTKRDTNKLLKKLERIQKLPQYFIERLYAPNSERQTLQTNGNWHGTQVDNSRVEEV